MVHDKIVFLLIYLNGKDDDDEKKNEDIKAAPPATEVVHPHYFIHIDFVVLQVDHFV